MQYMAHIEENGTDRMASIDTLGNITEASSEIIAAANISDGAEVLIAWTEFNHTAQRFCAIEYRFTVDGGRTININRA